jgi:molybdopterin-containing oxidoreductase family iron-sulfur binding subunit
MSAGNVDTLLIIGGNPAFNAPPDLNFADAMSKVRLRIRLGSHADETSLLCHWQLPESHYLEAWGDARAFDGTVSIIQPLIAPLYDSKSAIEVLSILGGTLDKTGYEIVRAYWAAQKPSSDFDIQWQKWVEKGVVPGTALPAVSVSAKVPSTLSTVVDTAGVTEIAFRQDPHIFDGSWANNGWLQELPKPVSKIVWDNVALMSVATAEKLQVWNNDVVKITVGGTAIELPVWVQAGQPDDQITVHLGYGRTAGGRVANGVGVNVYKIRTSDKLWSAPVDAIEKTDKTYTICAVHTHHSIQSRSLPYTDLEAEVIKRAVVDGPDSEKPPQRLIDNRNLVRVATIAQLAKDPEAIRELEPDHEERQALRDQGKKVTLSLYQDYDDLYKQNYQWGMSIDMQTCIGCNACVIACQAENNITVVGKEQVSVGREMHWIRIDTYYGGELDNPEMYHQPLPCMHCENAPCEYVCPVEATVHDNEGVNDMVYNRCVGTRYCSNNCPYKVRRFNFFQYVDYTTESLKLQRNPEVTVRVRGVMEKCTYCIQRINETRYAIEKTQVQQEELANKATADGSPDVAADILAKMKITQQVLLDGLQTACQQACPTEAIVFGNINVDKEPAGDGRVSKVKQLKDSPLDYGLLTELTTRPRTTYLPRVTNPSDAMQKGSA